MARGAAAILVVLSAPGLLALPGGAGGEARARGQEEWYVARRQRMVAEQLRDRGIRDPAVLKAMETVPREEFVSAMERSRAYDDGPLPIGKGQTISQPYIVALMTELIAPKPDDVVLDIGTGSGYQAAVLAEIVKKVYSIEIIPELAESAAARLRRLGYDNVEVRTGDGWLGWPEHAPFDGIVLAAAPEVVPPPLLEQLAPGAALVLPVGDDYQDLVVHRKQEDGSIARERVISVRFVPMTGIAEDRDRRGANGKGH
jgi:protein-L-isoaspartate(D-aspartate) O-methyltransferase